MKNITTSLFLAIMMFLMTGLIMEAQSINSAESKAAFSISNMKWMTVEGTFTGMKGEISFDESNPGGSSFNVCMDAASVNTENQKRDDHLRNADFFDVEKYPQICFRSSAISATKKGFVANGTLEMHGVSKDVTINFTHTTGVFKGDLNINRYDYGVGADTGTFMVGEDVSIKITATVY